MVQTIIFLFVIFVVSGIIVFIWAGGGFQKPILSRGRIYTNKKFINKQQGNIQENIKEIKILSWNIGYGQGLGSEGSDHYAIKTKTEFDKTISDISLVIKESGADIVLIQEADFRSKRSYYQNQLKIISELAHFPYAARAVSWRANYVPFPYWPLNRHFEKVVSGGMILSKFPITKNKIQLLEKPKKNPWWYNFFYLFRFSQVVHLKINDRTFKIVNSHLEAWDQNNRIEQAKLLYERFNEWNDILVFGGDFNTVPTNSEKKDHFNGYPDDHYVDDITLSIFNKFKFLKETVTDAEFKQDEKKYFTFPSNHPDRKLDYLFVKNDCGVLEFKILKSEAGVLSDHFPIMTKITISPS